MRTNLRRLLALFLTLAMVLPMALPVLQVAAAETESANEGTSVYDFSEESQLTDFALYQSSNSGFTVADGYLVPDGTSGEMKALLKDTPQDIQYISVDIYPGESGLINVGLYVGASNAKNAADEINAQAFLIQSNFSGWTDAPNRIDIIHGSFADGWTELGRTISESGSGNNLFSGGVKQPLNLKLAFTQENIQLTLSLLSDPTKSVQCVYDAVDMTGLVGFRANGSDAKFDNLSIAYTPEENTESDSQYAYVGEFSQSEEAVNELPEGWVRHPNYKNGTLYQQNGALYFDALTASGVCAAFYDQDECTDYLIEADITMVDKANTSRWLGIGYRMNSDENAMNIFNLTWNNNCALSSYYGVAVTGYDGSTINRGWTTADTTYFPKQTFSATNFPEVLNAGQTTVNMKLAVVGNTLTGYVNGVKILEAVTHNSTQETGSFGIVTANTILKIENFKVTDLTPEEDLSQYAYVGDFSQSEEPVNELPEGWVRHPNYKNGTLYQQNGALHFDTKTASGICAAFYDQSEYTDYLIEADFIMLDRTNDARWMGFAYRANSDENAINMFFIKYNNAVGLNAYFGTQITCYDGTTIKGWGDSRATTNSLPATQYPELVDAGKGTVNLKLKVVGNTITGYVNDVKVLETTTYNVTQETGSFGITTSNADIKVENFRVTDLTPEEEPEPEIELRNAYVYEGNFAQQETTDLPEGWVRHPSYKNGTLIQKNGALYFNALDASGICTAYYDQTMYTDYLVEADFTMLDRTDNNRWMGFTFRMDNGETATNMFGIKYNNTATIHAYYGSAVTGYDGSTLNRGWAANDNIHFVSNTLPADKYPSLVDAGKGTVNLKMAVIGNKIYGFVNDVLVVEAVTHNSTQELGSFGISTANTNTKIKNFKVIDLTELNQTAVGNTIPHGLTLPTEGAADITGAAELENYVASSTLSFSADAAATASAKVMIAKAGKTELYATVQKNGTVNVYKQSSAGTQTLFTGTAAIADTTGFVLKTTYANGSVKISVDGTDLGYASALAVLPGVYGFVSDGTANLLDVQLNETVTNVSDIAFTSDLSVIEYNTTPDWSGLQLTCKLSDGSVIQPAITSDMISGFDPTESGTQNLTLTYTHGGKSFTESFTVLVGDDPANMPNAKIGIITDVHIGADASNGPALEKALQYYKSRGVDAIVCVGDIGHDKMEYINQFDTIYNSVFPDGEDGPQKFFVMGNHDTYAFENAGYARGTEEHNNAVEEYFTQTFDCEADYGRVGLNYAKIINGYIFVGLYIQTPIEERAAFLEQIFQLPEAQGKPVFIVQHEIPVGSIYIEKPSATSEDDLHDILVNYPNAVSLTGHSHNPLADERALWQGEYTAVSCGSLFGPIVEANMYEGGREKGSFQDNNWSAKAALYMEIRDAGINIVRYDFTHDNKLGKDWYIPINDGQIDLTPYNYALRTEAAVAPEFAADAKVTAEALSASMVRISFPKAITVYEEMDDIIQSYIIRAYNDDTNELVGEKRVISQHYLGRDLDHDSYTLTFTGLNASTNYRFEVVAVESYQKESSPLVVKADTKKFSTEGVTPTFYANFDYSWDAEEFDLYNHSAANTMTYTDGVLRANGANSSKAIIKDLTFANGTIDMVISKNSTGTILSAGVYLFASGAADEQDTITAYNVHLDSGAGSKDLTVAIYKFSGKYDKYLSLVTLTDYFADGVNKADVHLQVEVSNGILSVFVDGNCVMTYTVGTMSGGVGLRSHYSAADFRYIRVYENSVEYTAPDTTELDALFTEAKDLLAATEVEGTGNYTGKNPYVTQETYGALESIVNTYDADLIRAYERHVAQVKAILTEGIAQFKQGILLPAVAQVGEHTYASVTEAIAAANGETVKVLMDTEEEITIHADVTIDLAGNSLSNVTVAEGSLQLIDTVTGGTATVTGSVETFTEADGKTYLVVGENGVYSAHAYSIAITHISLDPANDALGYKAKLIGDEVVQSQVTGIGFNLWVDGGNVKTYTTTGKQEVTLRLKNILAAGGGEMNINATAFVILGDHTETSTQQTTTMKQALQLVNDNWDSYSQTQRDAVKALCDQYPAIFKAWELNNILG